MANLNKVFLIGNLTRDPELRYTQGGTALAKLGMAINREYGGGEGGEKKSEVCYVEIEVWGKLAEIANQYLQKGRPLFVEGRLRFSQWKDREGQNRSKLTVVCEGFQFLDFRGKPSGGPGARPPEDADGPPAEPPAGPPPKDDDIPF